MIGIVVLVLFTYAGFTKFANPFANPYTVTATFQNANQLRPGSLVRIAGVNVGVVTTITPVTGCGSANAGCQAAHVAMQINDNGLPIHSDATFKVRPRTFLEGNFFIDVHPGSPSAPAVASGHTFPVQQGQDPVQLDQVLTALPTATRQNLQILLNDYGTAVKVGGPSFNASIPYWLPAYKYSSVVAHDLLGYQPHDLSNFISQAGTVSAALDAHPQNLQNLITDFNTTASAFATQNAALQQAVAELPSTLATATPAFNALNAAFPPLRALARALVPGVQTAAPAIDVSLPFVYQLRQLVQPAELRGLASNLAVTIPALARLTNGTIPLMRDGVRPASSCATKVVIPWSKLQINHPNFNASNGFPPRPAYVELLQLLPGIAGESRDYDANGSYIRLLFGGGMFTYSLQPGVFGTTLAAIDGVQPVPPRNDARPPLQENVPCETQAPISTLDTPAGPPPPQVPVNNSTPAALSELTTEATALQSVLGHAIKQAGLPLKLSDKWATRAQIAGQHR
jgi:virulence factor Mce-like protein